MDVLITGAGGRIGSHLAERLVADGHRVRALALADDPAVARLAARVPVDVVVGDLRDRNSLVPAVAGVGAICHLAAALTTHDATDDTFVDVNIGGTYHLLSAAKDGAPGITRFVYTSSDAAYWPALGNRPLFLPVDESHPLMAGSVYGATKVAAEALCGAFWRSYGIPPVVIRPTATASPAELINPGSPFGRRWFLSAAIARLRGLGDRTPVDEALLAALDAVDDGTERLVVVTNPDGAASLSMLTDARDVAAAMHLALFAPEAVGEAFTIGPAAPHSERELVEALGRHLGLDVVEVRHEGVRPSWYVSSAKAYGVLGYRPRWTVFDMVAEAVT